MSDGDAPGSESTPAIHPLIRERRSLRAFRAESLDDAQLGALLEAARWAASCFNAQPWRFVVALRRDEEAFARLLSVLNEKNRAWAQHAGALVVSVAQRDFEASGKPNAHAWHDVGLAVAQLTLQAEALDLTVHQMAGFDKDAARRELEIPEGFDPVAVLAIAKPGDPADLPEDLRRREQAPRQRKALGEVAFHGRFGRGYQGGGGR